MAHPYTTRAKVRQLCTVADRVADLLDGNGDGTEDTIDGTTVIADAIEFADTLIDGRLAGKYDTPFNGLSDTPPTPSLISRISGCLVLAHLYSAGRDPDAADAKYWRDLGNGLLADLKSGSTRIDAALVAVRTRRPVRSESAGTVVAGRVDGDYTDEGSDKSSGI